MCGTNLTARLPGSYRHSPLAAPASEGSGPRNLITHGLRSASRVTLISVQMPALRLPHRLLQVFWMCNNLGRGFDLDDWRLKRLLEFITLLYIQSLHAMSAAARP